MLKLSGLVVASLLALTACSTADSLLPDRRPDYRQSKTVNPLEVPPDLTASTHDDALVVPDLQPNTSASLSDYASERTESGIAKDSEAVLQAPAGMHIERSGERRWLVLEQTPEQAWPRIKDFWTSNGLPLVREDSRIGIMETDWLENRADIPGDPIRSIIKRFLDVAYSAPTRDKFRVRIERTGPKTEVFLTHYGMEEVVVGSNIGRREENTTTRWQPRPADPELEAEMLNRLMVHLGASEKRAQAELAKSSERQPDAQAQTARVRAGTTSDGQQALIIREDYDRSWRLVGLALDAGNYAVEDQNRDEGLYVVEYRPEGQKPTRKKGLLSRLAFWRDDDEPAAEGTRYRVRLAGQGAETLVVVHDADERPDNSPTAQKILNAVREVIARQG
ncbi:MAG: outer membrane protein assembly factor BamC [Gammaproteobacteria bacterium]